MDMVRTNSGLMAGHLLVIVLWEHKGASCVRTLNTVSGLYVDVQASPKGRRQYVNTGSLSKQELKDWIVNV